MSFSENELLLAAKVWDIALEMRGQLPTEPGEDLAAWRKKNPIEDFIPSAMRQLKEIALAIRPLIVENPA